MPTIGPKTLEAVADRVRALLMENKTNIDKAWLHAGKILSIPVSLKFKQGPGYEEMEYLVSMDIVTDRVKPVGSGIISENGELFPREGEEGQGSNVVPMKARRVTIPEQWISGFEWLIGWGQDIGYIGGFPICMDLPEPVESYNDLNRLRDRHEIEREFMVLMDREREWQETYGIMDDGPYEDFAEAIG
ncbi:MAG: hypothetical protein A4E62_01561 [Syntrophorhabdus sp. PtaU1.Bin002]|nr:MAG: hypothetical protein A4E62_01561 [Syntrophorhabdus sp. PtaU1.Bin002]